MSNVFRFPARPDFYFKYKDGDICRALAEGVRHEVVATDIEHALFALLFESDDDCHYMARDLLADLLHANQGTA
jgi:hypothetical protein